MTRSSRRSETRDRSDVTELPLKWFKADVPFADASSVTDRAALAETSPAPRPHATASEIVAAYRAGLSIREVAEVYRMSPSLVAQLVVAARATRTRRRPTLVVAAR